MLCRVGSLRRVLPVSSRQGAWRQLCTALPQAQAEQFVDHPEKQLQLSTLPNGVRVATVELFGNAATVGVLASVGTRDEQDNHRGATSLLQHLAFRSTKQKSTFQLARECERLGANWIASGSHELLSVSGEVLRPGAPALLELLTGVLVDPAFHPWELAEARKEAIAEHAEVKSTPMALLSEGAHTAAFASQTLGKSLFVPAAGYNALDGASLRAFLASSLSGDGVCVVGVNTDHAEFVEQSTRLFGSLPPTREQPRKAAKYVGGDFHVEASAASTTVGLFFNGPAVGDERLVEFSLLLTLLGNSASFAIGGPGRGTFSRLANSVPFRCPQFVSASSLAMCFSDSGLFGVVGETVPSEAGELVETLIEELHAVAESIGEGEWTCAKNQLKSSYLMSLEQNQVIVDDIARQLLATGKYLAPSTLLQRVDELDPQEVLQLAEELLATPLTYVAHGDLRTVPRFQTVAQRFRR